MNRLRHCRGSPTALLFVRMKARRAVGTSRSSAIGGAVAAFGVLVLLSTASGPASAQEKKKDDDYPPNTNKPFVVPDAVPPAPSVLGAVLVATTTTTTTTTTGLPAAAVVLGKSLAAPAEENVEVLGTSITAPVAFTGSNSAPTALAGLGLFAAGSALVIGARRRSTPRRSS